jgi:hypothetical protein
MSEAAEELIPVRALNQVSYCLRLYYPVRSGSSRCIAIFKMTAIG